MFHAEIKVKVDIYIWELVIMLWRPELSWSYNSYSNYVKISVKTHNLPKTDLILIGREMLTYEILVSHKYTSKYCKWAIGRFNVVKPYFVWTISIYIDEFFLAV